MNGTACWNPQRMSKLPVAARVASLREESVCRRGYTHSRYRRIMDNIRRHMPDASISGDAIVGFPGETVGNR